MDAEDGEAEVVLDESGRESPVFKEDGGENVPPLSVHEDHLQRQESEESNKVLFLKS